MFYAFFNALMKNFVIVKKSDNETNCGLLQSIYHANTVQQQNKFAMFKKLNNESKVFPIIITVKSS